MTQLSRRKISEHAAQRIAAAESVDMVLSEVAGYLIDAGRIKEAGLVTRDIEEKLLKHGVAIVTIVSARTLQSDAKQMIEKFIKSHDNTIKTVYLRESIDKSLIAGVRIELPGKQLDMSVKSKLEKLTV